MAVSTRAHRIIQIGWPEFGQAAYPPPASSVEFQLRVDKLRAVMDERKLTHLVVYGDREHFANVAYLTGFDPRFEETLFILSAAGTPLLVVGNECEAYVGVSPLFTDGKLRRERFQPFSLLNQPREQSRKIRDVFAGEGIDGTSRVGCVGWKYFSDQEVPGAQFAIELPSYLIDTLRTLAGQDRVVNSTDLLMHPGYGLRTFCTPSEIAYFEYTSVQASESVKRLIFGMREGMTDHEVVALGGTCGEPLGCHVTFTTGRNAHLGLSGPRGEKIKRGEPLSFNLSYWGSNSCRSGWIASSARDLPAAAADYVAGFAGVYFEVMSEWFAMLKPGTAGGKLWRLIADRLPFERYGIFLNPGHLIHLDEWLSSPVYPNSEVPLHSGMAIQVDVIPSSPVYASTRMEDGLVLADKELRKQLQQTFPDCYARCQKRRKFMTDVLGIELPEEILPLSNIPGIVPPFFLAPNEVFALEP
jgi:Creatinase/Prolidase N-terminal domain